MKKIILIISLFIASKSFGQIDSSTIMQTMVLQQKYHLYLIGFISNMSSTDKINYAIQVKKAYNTSTDTLNISVDVPSSLILDMYANMTMQPQGVTADYNASIKSALIPQMTNSWLRNQIIGVITRNTVIRDAAIEKARAFLLSISL